MPSTRARRYLVMGQAGLQQIIEGLTGYVLDYEMQEPFGDVALATNIAVALGRELLFEANAASDPNGNEADATTGVLAQNATLTSDGTVFDVGSFSLKYVATANTGRMYRNLASRLETGRSYRLMFSYRHVGSGGAQFIGLGTTNGTITGPIVSNILNTVVTFQNVIYDFTYDGSTHYFICREINPTDDGGLYVDNTSLRQLSIAASSALPGPKLLVDGDMEAAGVGDWTVANGAVLSKQTTDPHGGTQVLRVARNGNNNPGARQTIMTIGTRYNITGFVRSDGNAEPKVRDGVGTVLFTGTTSTDWQEFDLEYAAASTIINLSQTSSISGEYVEFDDVSVREANPLNLTNTGMSVAQTGAGNVPLVYSGDGVTSRLTFDSIAEYNSIINMSTGGKMVFAKSDTWAAGIDVLWRSAVDANNEIVIFRDGTDLKIEYRQGGVSSIVTIPSGSPSGFFTIGGDWNVTGDGLRGFYNGVQSGSAVAIAAAIIGNLDVDECAIFATDSAGANSWAGDGGVPVLCNETPTTVDHANYHRAIGI